MDKNELRQKTASDMRDGRKFTSVEWPTVGLIAACYATWLAAGALVYPFSPFVALALMSVAVALHSSLQHEVLHGHPTRNRLVNEALVSFPIGLFYPYRRFKHLHLKHHADERLTDPYDDPESYYRAAGDWKNLHSVIKVILNCNNTLIGRIVFGPALMIVGFVISETKLLINGGRRVRLAWLLHAAGLVPTVTVIWLVFGIPLWVYAVTTAYWGLSIIAIRTYCEHQWSETPDGRTVIVESSPLALLFLNNNLHFVHHKRPTAPWYDLPKIYRDQREEWQQMNGGYVFRSYLDIARAFAFRKKEQVVHPMVDRNKR